jgi:hypothetical protein
MVALYDSWLCLIFIGANISRAKYNVTPLEKGDQGEQYALLFRP